MTIVYTILLSFASLMLGFGIAERRHYNHLAGADRDFAEWWSQKYQELEVNSLAYSDEWIAGAEAFSNRVRRWL